MPVTKQNSETGLSLVELVMVLAVLAVLASIAAPRYSSDGAVLAHADKLARDLRHVQSMAMYQGRSLLFSVRTGEIYDVTHDGNRVTDPASMQPYMVTLEDDVTLSGTDTAFDTLGRPVFADVLLSAERIFTLTGSTRSVSVTLSPVTGFVTVSP